MNRMTTLVALASVGTAALALADNGPQHQVRQIPPIKLGTSGGEAADASGPYCCAGTLGALVLRDGVPCILSNNHVLARSGSAATGEDTVQPGLIDVNCAAGNAQVVADFAGDLVPLGTGNVDTGLSVVRSGMVDMSGAILDVGVPCSNPQLPALNMQVMKSGRTTGFTTGTITSLNTRVTIQYQRGCGTGRKFNVTYNNQIVTSNMSAGGDSGSLLLSNDGTPNPVGLLFAGSNTATIYNPINDVINAYRAGNHTFSFVGNSCGGLLPEATPPGPAQQVFDVALRVKVEHEDELMRVPGVCGVGVGSAIDDITKAVIVVYMEKPKAAEPGRGGTVPQAPAATVPTKIDEVPIRVVYTEPFVAQ